MDWTLWMTLAVIPALSAMFWWLWRVQAQLVELESQLLNQLADFKLDVAKNYASNLSLREVEARLVAHLNRIEAKLDRSRRADEWTSR